MATHHVIQANIWGEKMEKKQTIVSLYLWHAYVLHTLMCVCEWVCECVCAYDTVSRDSPQPLAFYLLHEMNEGNIVSKAVVQAFLHLVEYDSCMQSPPPFRTFNIQHGFGCSRQRAGIWLESSSLTKTTAAVTTTATVLLRNRSPPNAALCNL